MKLDQRNWLFLLCCVVLLTACSQVSPSTPGNSALAETTEALETPLPLRFRSMAAGAYGTLPDHLRRTARWLAGAPTENGELPGVNSSLSFEERQVVLGRCAGSLFWVLHGCGAGARWNALRLGNPAGSWLGSCGTHRPRHIPKSMRSWMQVQMADTGMGYAAARGPRGRKSLGVGK